MASSYAKLISTLEEKVIERTSKLELAKEFQQRFFANVSHEFRTPLTISEGLLSKVITKGKVQDEQTMYDLWLAKRNMLRLHDMVNQIIELTKADHHELKLNKKFYYIAEIVGLCVESFRSLAENHDHSFTYELIDERLIVHVDVANVEIIINNFKHFFNNLFLSINLQLKNKFYEQVPENFNNLYIPGFNKTNDYGNFGAGFGYGISYLIPIYKK